MGDFKSWIFSVCAAVVIVTLLSMLSPSGKMEKVMKFVISIFFVILIASPVISAVNKLKGFDVNDYEFNFSSYSPEENLNETARLYKEKIEETLLRGLKDKKIFINNLSATVNITEDNCIKISKITITASKTLSSKEEAQIIKYIKKEVKLIPEIIRE